MDTFIGIALGVALVGGLLWGLHEAWDIHRILENSARKRGRK
jgi:hypothetical protein